MADARPSPVSNKIDEASMACEEGEGHKAEVILIAVYATAGQRGLASATMDVFDVAEAPPR